MLTRVNIEVSSGWTQAPTRTDMRYSEFGEGGRARRAGLIAVTLFSVQPALAGCQGTIGDLPFVGTTAPGTTTGGPLAGLDGGGGPAADGGIAPSPCEATPRPAQRVALRSELQFANGLL